MVCAGGGGRAHAYASGVRSARGIERRCREDVAFRVLTANQVPDHATIARFRARHEDAIAGLFGGVLELCAKAGLVKVGVVAVDGTKVAAAATHHATRSYEQIAKEILEEAAEIDAREDELFGEARGDELPEGLRTSGDRRRVLREASRRWTASGPPRPSRSRAIGASGFRSAWPGWSRIGLWSARWSQSTRPGTRVASRLISSDTLGARALAKPYPLPDQPAGKVNLTDPDSRNLKTTRGWVQGYNAQAAVTADQIVIAAEISVESLDTANLQPLVESACAELQAAGVDQRPGVVLADAGYWKNEAIEALVGQGIQTLVAPDADKRKQPRPGRRGGLYDFTRRVLATDWGAELYRKRQGSVESVFGQIKANRGANRFLRRGRTAVRSECDCWLPPTTCSSSTGPSSPPAEPNAATEPFDRQRNWGRPPQRRPQPHDPDPLRDTLRAEEESQLSAGSAVVAERAVADNSVAHAEEQAGDRSRGARCVSAQGVRALCELSCDDAELYTLTEGVTEIEPFRGHAGIARWIDTELEPWDDFRIQPSEIREVGDRVLVRAKVSARGHGSKIELEADCGLVFDFREERIAWLRSFLHWRRLWRPQHCASICEPKLPA